MFILWQHTAADPLSVLFAVRKLIILYLPQVFFLFPQFIHEPLYCPNCSSCLRAWKWRRLQEAGTPWSKTVCQMLRSKQGEQQITTVEIKITQVWLYSLNDPGLVSRGWSLHSAQCKLHIKRKKTQTDLLSDSLCVALISPQQNPSSVCSWVSQMKYSERDWQQKLCACIWSYLIHSPCYVKGLYWHFLCFSSKLICRDTECT